MNQPLCETNRPKTARVLFSQKDDWERGIRHHVTQYRADFADFFDPATGFEKYDAIIPLTLDVTHLMNSEYGKECGANILLPTDAIVRQCHDKLVFADFMASIEMQAHIPITGQHIALPYTLKKREDAWGEGTTIITSEAQERMLFEKVASGAYFKQEYIGGRSEFSSHILMASDRIAFMRSVEFQFNEDYFIYGKRHAPSKVKKVEHRQFAPLFHKILSALKYEGFCCIDYKVLPSGDVKIFELNPRVGGSLKYFMDDAVTAYLKALKDKQALA